MQFCTIQLASEHKIHQWCRIQFQNEHTYSQVSVADTLNYRTLKPVFGGLFCETVFGPVKDWQCQCGRVKLSKPPKSELWCPNCFVQITRSVVRRIRMGYIQLGVPVVHIWYKTNTNPLLHIFCLNSKQLNHVVDARVFCVSLPSHIWCVTPVFTLFDFHVWNHQVTPYMYPKQVSERRAPWHPEYHAQPNSCVSHTHTYEGTSGMAVFKIVQRLNLKQVMFYLSSRAKRSSLDFVTKLFLRNIRLESILLQKLPVLPPELRPIIQVENGKFATSDINDLYRFVVFRNNRLKRFLQTVDTIPEAILFQEIRLVQHSVDALFDNSKLKQPMIRASSSDRIPLKSLADRLVGKRGRFRQNLLGKRVDYSGRSVIVVGTNLRLFECGIPIQMAFEIFLPFVIQKVFHLRYANTTNGAKHFLKQKPNISLHILRLVVCSHPVIMNRAPTLHRMGIQAFFPVLSCEKAIQLHPLVCASFNADFDGDQMAVHVPLTSESQIEARVLMLAQNNWLSPASGEHCISMTQDIVLGFYYLSVHMHYGDQSVMTPVWIQNTHCVMCHDTHQHLLACVVSPQSLVYKMYTNCISVYNSFGTLQVRFVLTTLGRLLINRLINHHTCIQHDSADATCPIFYCE